jgi:hypothetical protein
MLPRATPSFMAPRDALTAEMRQSIVLKAIAYLQEIRLPRTLQELQTKFPHLPVELISRHEAVIVDATTMTMLYKPVVARKYARAVTNKTTMLSLLDEHPGGILLKDLEDAYAGAREDVAAMIKDGSVLQLEVRVCNDARPSRCFSVALTHFCCFSLLLRFMCVL